MLKRQNNWTGVITSGPGYDQPELGGDDDAGDGLVVAGEDGPRGGTVALADDGAGACVPVPEEDGAVLGAGGDVAVGGDVALGASQAGDDAVVAEHDLHDLGGLGREDPVMMK